MLNIVLKVARPIVKQKMKDLIIQYQGYAENLTQVHIIKKYLLDIFNEVIEDFIKEKNL